MFTCAFKTMSFINVFVILCCLIGLDRVYGDCGILSKAEWDGLQPMHVQYLPRPVKLVIIQHTATPTCSSNEGCAELVRNIQTNHMEQQGYWDIGPSFLIGGNGKVFEGSGWLHVGAHTYKYNDKSIGITFIGNFNNEEPTQAAMSAAQDLIRCGVERGHLDKDYNLVAHRQLIAIESPGRKLYNKMRSWPHYLENIDSIKNSQR